MKKAILTLALLLVALPFVYAQDNATSSEPVTETFSSTRTINLQTIESIRKKTLSYRIMHRFGIFESGAYGLWGLAEGASVGLQFEYGISDRINLSAAYMHWNKMINLGGKFRILTQTSDNKMPLTLSAYAKVGFTNLRPTDVFGFSPDTTEMQNFANRMTGVMQVMVARKFGERFSVQLNPTLIHFNHDWATYGDSTYSKQIFALTGQLSYKVSKRMAVNLEYTHVFSNYLDPMRRSFYHDNLGVSVDLKTGGHCFSFFVINAPQIDEEFAIPFNFVDWLDFDKSDLIPGGFRFGFNISRNFHL